MIEMDEAHKHFLEIGKNVGYDDAKREYFIVVKRLGRRTSIVHAISFCPICGEKFPKSLRNEWFDRLEGIGIDPFKNPIPAPYVDGTWWRAERLAV
jgi:uncharacterized protein DUF6980